MRIFVCMRAWPTPMYTYYWPWNEFALFTFAIAHIYIVVLIKLILDSRILYKYYIHTNLSKIVEGRVKFLSGPLRQSEIVPGGSAAT